MKVPVEDYIFGFVTLVCSLFGGGWGVIMFFEAESAPQQAAAAGFACAISLVPYIMTRSIQIMNGR